MPLPLAAIIRSSDRVAERQREGTYHGDEDQLADVERYCKARRLAYELLPPELDVSGGKPIEQRPSLRAAIEGVEAGIYSGIVTANLKRLTRSRSGLAIWERVEAAGGHVHTAAEAIDTSTPNGRFMRDVFLADAVREREEHSERHARRRAATVEAGMWRQRQLPRGYAFAGPAVDGKYTGKARRLVPGPDADDVRRAFRDRAAGVPVVQIADRLGMTASGVRAMLRNRVYLGELRDGDNVNPAAHDPLVTIAEFVAVQGQPRPARAAGGVALLAGLVRCEGCGHVMTRSGPGAHHSYVCFGRSSAGKCPAAAAIGARKLEEHVVALALRELERLGVESASADSGADDARDRLTGAERELAAYLEAVSADDVGPDAFAAAARSRRQAVEQAREEVRRRIAIRPVAPVYGSPGEVWDALDAHGRNALLRALLEVVVVRRAGGRGAQAPLADRVRVVAFGAGLNLVQRRAGVAAGVRPLRFEDLDVEHCLGMPGAEDAL